MTFLLGRRLLGKAGAALAVLIFTMVPTLLAHAGLATTDMGITASLAAAFYTWLRWIEEPNPRTGVWMGLGLALAILTKLSALAFYPAGLGGIVAVWRLTTVERLRSPGWLTGRRIESGLLALAVTFVVVWAGYFFSIGRIPGIPFAVPFPDLFNGVRFIAHHNAEGHWSFLLGEVRTTGWWYFFPFALLIKLPIAMLALVAVGLIVIIMGPRPADLRSRTGWPLWIAAAIPASILAVSLPSHINLGTR